MTTQITITWNSTRCASASATLELDGFWNQISNKTLMDSIYTATNLQSELVDFGYKAQYIKLWNKIQEVLPVNRSHTSLSIGDNIQINRTNSSIANQDGPTYRVAEVGFVLVEKVGA